MQVSLRGEDHTQRRFLEYMASNPAVRNGWVTWDADSLLRVTDEYVDPFREIAANFGLEVAAQATSAEGESDPLDGGQPGLVADGMK